MVSDAHRLTCNVAGDWVIWPNPVATTLHVKAPFGNAIAGIEVTDLLGQVILRQTVDNPQIAALTIDLDGKLPAAIYTLKIFASKGNPVVKKFEIRH
jgi:hypothetical protein